MNKMNINLFPVMHTGNRPELAFSRELYYSTILLLRLQILKFGGSIKLFVQVLQWMEDAGVRPSNSMYLNISTYAQESGGADYAAVIKERVGM